MKLKYQQGDVLLFKVENGDFPEEELENAKKLKHCVLAEGEATGHKHQMDALKATLFLVGTAMYLKVLQKTVLRHEEHNPIPVDIGTYKVKKVIEYDHFEEEIKEVRD